MHITETEAYRRAYTQYLRKGTPISLSLKAEFADKPTTHYIWRTRGDDKVRGSHAENNGKIFAWNDPPATGHPGQDYGCRCWAEPYEGLVDPLTISMVRIFLLNYLVQTYPWGDFEMSLYFFVGNGLDVSLDSIGHSSIIEEYYYKYYFWRFENQLKANAYDYIGEVYEGYFDASYDFQDVLYSYRQSRIRGKFLGKIIENNGKKILSGRIIFNFDDEFKDPLSLAQLYVVISQKIPFIEEVQESDLSEFFRSFVNLWQKPYKLRHSWEIEYISELK